MGKSYCALMAPSDSSGPFDGNFPAGTDYTVFLVQSRFDTTSENFVIARDTNAPANGHLHIGYRVGSTYAFAQWGNDISLNIGGSVANDWAMSTSVFDSGSGHSLRYESTALGVSSVSNGNTQGLNSWNNATVGARSSSVFFNGDICRYYCLHTRANARRTNRNAKLPQNAIWYIINGHVLLTCTLPVVTFLFTCSSLPFLLHFFGLRVLLFFASVFVYGDDVGVVRAAIVIAALHTVVVERCLRGLSATVVAPNVHRPVALRFGHGRCRDGRVNLHPQRCEILRGLFAERASKGAHVTVRVHAVQAIDVHRVPASQGQYRAMTVVDGLRTHGALLRIACSLNALVPALDAHVDRIAQIARIAVLVLHAETAHATQPAAIAVPEPEVAFLAMAVTHIAIVLCEQTTVALCARATLTNGRRLHAIHTAHFLDGATVHNVIFIFVVTHATNVPVIATRREQEEVAFEMRAPKNIGQPGTWAAVEKRLHRRSNLLFLFLYHCVLFLFFFFYGFTAQQHLNTALLFNRCERCIAVHCYDCGAHRALQICIHLVKFLYAHR